MVVFITFLLSYYIEPYYVNGDQTVYNFLYYGIQGLGILDGFSFYKANIDSREYMHFLIIWVASNLNIDKTYLVSVVNSLLSFLAYRFLVKRGGNPLIVFLIVVFGFYSQVLFFAAERLKFGFLFLLVGLNYSKYSYIWFITSVATHIQLIMVYTSAALVMIKDDIKKLIFEQKVRKSFIKHLIAMVIATIVITVILIEQILSKFHSYFDLNGIFELSKLTVFFVLSLIYCKRRTEVAGFFIPLFLFVFIFGGSRVNLLGYFAFLYFSVGFRSGFNAGILLTTTYFLYTSYLFISKVILYGDGFY